MGENEQDDHLMSSTMVISLSVSKYNKLPVFFDCGVAKGKLFGEVKLSQAFRAS